MQGGKVALLVGLVVMSFLAGSWYTRRTAGTQAAPQGRRILYYHDPMHPAYKSDKPGIAPDCGMQLEPVYADGGPAASAREAASAPASAVQVSAEQQQILGVKLGRVEKASWRHTIRAPGRVAFDETRVYRVTTATDGWIRKTYPVSTGSVVNKDELLATFYNRDFLTAQQTYFYALNTLDRFTKSKENAEQMGLTEAQVRSAEENLQALGMGEIQVREIARARKAAREIEIRAPITGFVVTRNVFTGLRFDRGAELFQIAELGHLWILADVFETEARLVRTASGATVRYQGQSFHPRISNVPPIFDRTTRTFKVRLEQDNPDHALRPDMFVDVEFAVNLPAAITLPVDAVIDSGLRKTVFVDRGNGYFDPRVVETGWRLGERVEILKGLAPGENVVVSGNFLLGSESRMKAAAMGVQTPAKDLVCGMDVDQLKAAAAGRKSEHRGKDYYFCSDQCKKEFDKDPQRYLAAGRPHS